MADTKLSALTELAATPADDDEVYIRDISEAAADESKRITTANLLSATTGVHGVGAGAIVGTTLTQELTNKTLNAGAGSATIATTGVAEGLLIQSTQDGVGGAFLTFRHVSASPANGDNNGFSFQFKNSIGGLLSYGIFKVLVIDPTSTSESSRFDIVLKNAGADNECLKLSGVGVLDVDASSGLGAATVGEFDLWDDLRAVDKAIRTQDFADLVDMGVFTRKDTGSRYFMNLQAAHHLGWCIDRQLYGHICQLKDAVKVIAEHLGVDNLSLDEIKALPVGGN